MPHNDETCVSGCSSSWSGSLRRSLAKACCLEPKSNSPQTEHCAWSKERMFCKQGVQTGRRETFNRSAPQRRQSAGKRVAKRLSADSRKRVESVLRPSCPSLCPLRNTGAAEACFRVWPAILLLKTTLLRDPEETPAIPARWPEYTPGTLGFATEKRLVVHSR